MPQIFDNIEQQLLRRGICSGTEDHLLDGPQKSKMYKKIAAQEAVEICKLRLFLKLVAQVEDPSRIEPLPGIDLNTGASPPHWRHGAMPSSPRLRTGRSSPTLPPEARQRHCAAIL